jgi:hypothetical protein
MNAMSAKNVKGVKVLYIGVLAAGTTSLQRRNVLSRIGCIVDSVEQPNYRTFSRIEHFIYRVSHWFFRKGFPVKVPGSGRVNADALKFGLSKNYDVVWIDKGLLVRRETLVRIKERNSQCLIYGYSPDVMSERDNQSRYFLQHADLYDCFFTTKTFDVDNLLKLGMRSVKFVENSFDKEVHRPLPADDDRFCKKIGFVGSYESPREASMLHMAESGIPVTVFGGGDHGWSRSFKEHPLVEFHSEGLFGDDYAKALTNFAINLCFLKHWNGDQVTQRSMEIPACRGFMLAERTDEHMALFEEGAEVAFFSSDTELADKAGYFLDHPEERAEIASAGFKRAIDQYELSSCLTNCLLCK